MCSNAPDSGRRAFLAAAATAAAAVPASHRALASDGDDRDGEESPPDRDWPAYGFNAANTFHQYQTDAPSDRLRLAWRRDGLQGVPIVADGVLYATGRRPDSDGSELHAVDLETRERLWWSALPGRVFAEPAVADGTVYVNTEDAALFALDAATGEVRWRHGVRDSYGVAPPTVNDGVVYALDGDRVFSLAADGDLRWCRYGDFEPWFPMAVARGRVYAVHLGGDGVGPGLRALDATTGERAWAFSPDGAGDSGRIVTMPPAVADGAVYTCVQTDDEYLDLTALDAATGDVLWQHAVEGGMFGTVALADGRVYVPLTRRLVALDAASGDVVWRHRVEAPDHPMTRDHCVSTPTVADGAVFIGTHDGRVRALDAETGEYRCEYAVGGQFDLRRPPTVVDSTVYVTGTYVGEGHVAPEDMHLFALAATGDESVTAGFRMERTRTDRPGRGDHFRTGREMGFYADRSTGPIAGYEWNLTGDGTVDATGRLVTHTYERAGRKTVTLTVTGETGATASVSKSFRVRE